MKTIEFKEVNVRFAENQPEYQTLPALKFNDGTIVCCWKLSFKERIKLLITGKLWHSVLTFNQPFQPQYLTIDKSEVI